MRLVYDSASRLAGADTDDGEHLRFDYDALGRRIRKASRGQVVEYVWDGNRLLGERVWQGEAGDDGPGTCTSVREFVYLADFGEPVAVLCGDESLLLEGDHLGRPLLALSADGRVLLELDFFAFGKVRERRGTADVPFRFPGQVEDPETGLFYNRFRYYDPELRIYTQPDPLGLNAGLLGHDYVPDPLLWVDPLGLMPWVFRNVLPAVLESGIAAKLPFRAMTPIGHVLNGSKPHFKGSQYISATKLMDVADKWRKPGEITVKFQIEDVVPDIKGELQIIDVSTKQGAQAAGLKGSALNYSNASKEVLIVGHVPPKSIKVCD